MNDDSEDALDQLLGDWAASREAAEQHTSRLANQILSAVRDQPMPACVHAASMSEADWGGRLMIGGGGLLLFLVLAGCLLYYNMTKTAPGNMPRTSPIAAAGGERRKTTDAGELPVTAMLDATTLAAKQQLLMETSSIFDNQLAWIADGERDVQFELDDRAVSNHAEFMLVRVVVAQRASPESPWSTVWQTDVISRNEALVEVPSKQPDGSSLALWTYRLSDGSVAVDMDLSLDQTTRRQSSSSAVLQAGQPARVGCSSENGIEQCVFQTVMPLNPSQI